MYEVDRERFEGIVQRAVAELPAAFRERIDNVAFDVEEQARLEDHARAGAPRGILLGVYRGVPLPRHTSGYQMTLPDRIVIFRAPLQRMARDEAHLHELVRHTVLHEIAHYFGISDERLRELGAY